MDIDLALHFETLFDYWSIIDVIGVVIYECFATSIQLNLLLIMY